MEEKRFTKPEIIKSYEKIIEGLWNSQDEVDSKQNRQNYRIIIDNLVKIGLTQIFCIAVLTLVMLLLFGLHFLHYIR